MTEGHWVQNSPAGTNMTRGPICVAYMKLAYCCSVADPHRGHFAAPAVHAMSNACSTCPSKKGILVALAALAKRRCLSSSRKPSTLKWAMAGAPSGASERPERGSTDMGAYRLAAGEPRVCAACQGLLPYSCPIIALLGQIKPLKGNGTGRAYHATAYWQVCQDHHCQIALPPASGNNDSMIGHGHTAAVAPSWRIGQGGWTKSRFYGIPMLDKSWGRLWTQLKYKARNSS